MALYPVFLDLDGAPVLVVGGGPVAARKVAGLVAAGAQVTVVAPEVCPELIACGPAVIERRVYRRGEVEGYRLVLTATGVGAVDGQVFEDGQLANVWVNAADDPPRCGFYLPAVLRRGAVTFAVSSGGRSPALASWLRDRLAERFGPELACVVDRLAEERAEIRDELGTSETTAWAERIDRAVAAHPGAAPRPRPERRR